MLWFGKDTARAEDFVMGLVRSQVPLNWYEESDLICRNGHLQLIRVFVA